MRRLWSALAVAATALALSTTPSGAVDPTSSPPPNPFLGPVGTATMHGDSEASDTTPYPGPGTGTVRARFTPLGAACPTILEGSDGYPQALCTTIVNRTPTAYLLNPATGVPLASLKLTKGSLLGGVYAYLDNQNRMVAANGNGTIVRITHTRNVFGVWRLSIQSSISVDAAVSAHCAAPMCDAVSSVNPDYAGRVWFSSSDGVAGYADFDTGVVRATVLGSGEHIENSISSAPQGVAVTTDHALYLLGVDADGNPIIRWRNAYDRGPARKPGQLSRGSGSTPTFFGPSAGAEYLTITDNAVPQENLLVYDAATGSPVCSVPVLPIGASGTENSPIGSGRSVYVASTYGYPYPTTPPDAGPSDPASADFAGGMTRVDVRADGSGCDTVWTDSVRSAAVPRLSTSTGQITTIARANPLGGTSTSELDRYSYTVINAATGAVVDSRLVGIGVAWDTLQTVGTIDPSHVYYQGTISGLIRIDARA